MGVIYRALLHMARTPCLSLANNQSFSTRVADSTCRLIVFEEVHPTVPSFLEAISEEDQGCCIDAFLC